MMALEILLLLISVTLLILTVCILSYLKLIFERKVDEPELDSDSDDLYVTLGEIKETLMSLERRLQLLEAKHEDVLHVPSEKPMNKGIPTSEEICELNKPIPNKVKEFDSVSYNDAINAFQNINNAIHDIRRFKEASHALLSFLYSGDDSFESSILDSLAPEEREIVFNTYSKVKQFNLNYRQSLLDNLDAISTTWRDCVRFPYKQVFDDNWDENILGEDIEGEIIQRVVALGYEFPKSHIIGRQKSKVL